MFRLGQFSNGKRERLGAAGRSRRCFAQFPAIPTLAGLLVGLERVYSILDLRPQVGTMKRGLVHALAAALAVPAQSVEGPLRAPLLEDDADGVREAYGVVRRVRRHEEHLTLADGHVAECAVVDELQEHVALVLEEPLGRLVDVVVCPLVRAADDLR